MVFFSSFCLCMCVVFMHVYVRWCTCTEMDSRCFLWLYRSGWSWLFLRLDLKPLGSACFCSFPLLQDGGSECAGWCMCMAPPPTFIWVWRFELSFLCVAYTSPAKRFPQPLIWFWSLLKSLLFRKPSQTVALRGFSCLCFQWLFYFYCTRAEDAEDWLCIDLLSPMRQCMAFEQDLGSLLPFGNTSCWRCGSESLPYD